MTEDIQKKPFLRQVKSFVLRTGRMTEKQQITYDERWLKKGHNVEEGLKDLDSIFGRNQFRVLEIGFGMGDSLVQMMQESPETDFIGIEVHTPGVARFLNSIEEQNLNNAIVFRQDAIDVLEQCIPDNSIDRLQLYFPDPWHKKKHHKRRIVQHSFLALIHKKLKSDGVFHMATDWENYAEHTMEVLGESDLFENVAGSGQFSEKPSYRPTTKFERRGQRLGHGVWDMIFKKV